MQISHTRPTQKKLGDHGALPTWRPRLRRPSHERRGDTPYCSISIQVFDDRVQGRARPNAVGKQEFMRRMITWTCLGAVNQYTTEFSRGCAAESHSSTLRGTRVLFAHRVTAVAGSQ
jgi:hypothetical protein